MKKKIICTTLCVLLSICFVNTAQIKTNGLNTACLNSTESDVTAVVQQLQTLVGEIKNQIDATLQDVDDCVASSSGGNGNGGDGNVASCVKAAASSRAPVIQNQVDEYNTLKPLVEQIQKTIRNCLLSPPDEPQTEPTR